MRWWVGFLGGSIVFPGGRTAWRCLSFPGGRTAWRGFYYPGGRTAWRGFRRVGAALADGELLGVLGVGGLDDVDTGGVDAGLYDLTRLDGEGVEGDTADGDDTHLRGIA